MVLSANDIAAPVKKEKKLHICRKCKTPLDSHIHRSFFVKYFLFFLPLKRYMCYGCKRKTYRWA